MSLKDTLDRMYIEYEGSMLPICLQTQVLFKSKHIDLYKKDREKFEELESVTLDRYLRIYYLQGDKYG